MSSKCLSWPNGMVTVGRIILTSCFMHDGCSSVISVMMVIGVVIILFFVVFIVVRVAHCMKYTWTIRPPWELQ